MLEISVSTLEDVMDKTEQLSNMANAIHAAMFEGNYKPDEFSKSLYLFIVLFHQHAKEVRALFESSYSEYRSKGDKK